jgi:hypothetical protein
MPKIKIKKLKQKPVKKSVKFLIKQNPVVTTRPSTQLASKPATSLTPTQAVKYQGISQEWLEVTKELSTLFAIVSKTSLSTLPIEQYNKLLIYSSHVISRLNKARQLVKPAKTVFNTATWEGTPIELLEAYCQAIGTLYKMQQDVSSLNARFDECENKEAKQLVADALTITKISFVTFVNNVFNIAPAIKTYPGFLTNTAWLCLMKDLKRELADEAKNKNRTVSSSIRRPAS